MNIQTVTDAQLRSIIAQWLEPGEIIRNCALTTERRGGRRLLAGLVAFAGAGLGAFIALAFQLNKVLDFVLIILGFFAGGVLGTRLIHADRYPIIALTDRRFVVAFMNALPVAGSAATAEKIKTYRLGQTPAIQTTMGVGYKAVKVMDAEGAYVLELRQLGMSSESKEALEIFDALQRSHDSAAQAAH